MRRKRGAHRVDYWPRLRWNEERVVCPHSFRTCLCETYPGTTATGTAESSSFMGNVDLLQFPGGDFEDATRGRDGGELGSEFNDILKDIDGLLGPEQPDYHSDDRDSSVWDRRTSATLSPIVGPGEEMKQDTVRSLASSSPLPPLPSTPFRQGPKVRTKKKSSVGKMLDGIRKFKRLMAKKLGGGHQPQPKLSDSLVPEHDDEAKWYEGLFSSKPPKSARTRK